uniref:RING-type E3 ubiquitin transferase n=1 Tax=Hippocampus comes TaxID=109280 RepID=A0A3Q2Y436_HIPCM
MGMGMGMGGCGWPPFVDCRSRDDDEDYYGSAGLDAVSLASTASGLRSPQCRICFQGPEQGELLSPCRCDGSVRCTHQPCLIRWISERGLWGAEKVRLAKVKGSSLLLLAGLIIHEGSSVYRIFKRWQAVNQQWKVLNYEKAKDPGEPRLRTILNRRCGYTVLHILGRLRPGRPRLGAAANREVVMRVTTV